MTEMELLKMHYENPPANCFLCAYFVRSDVVNRDYYCDVTGHWEHVEKFIGCGAEIFLKRLLEMI